MSQPLKYYSIPNNCCCCRDRNEDLTKIGKYYKEFYQELKKGKRGVDILDEMGYLRCCCRIKLLSLPMEPMIDRSTDRLIDYTVTPNIRMSTRDLQPVNPPPDFPAL